MQTTVKFWQKDAFLLGIIILVGAALRFYDAFNIPFTHDELSTYYRLQFDSFSALIEGGIKTDTHPALVQVFMYYWTALFGANELVFKLPFMLLGIGTIPLSYSLTKRWFNSTSALWVAAFMASLQFPIMYGQMARPYISGLFFSLLLVHYWTRYLFESKSQNWKPLIGMIITASLCSYNHYFSLMFAGIVGVTGFFFVTKNTVKLYVIAMLSVVVLFLPHLGIFIHQFSNKGLDWLGKPGLSFYLEFIKFIFHFSFLAYIIPVLGLVYGIVQSKSIRLNKFQIISIIWFLLPITIGLLYSIFVKPVVQYSMLIFSFPFFLIFLFSFLKKSSYLIKLISVILILAINSGTLIVNRAHYTVFYAQPFERASLIISQFNAGDFTQDTPKNVHIIVADNPQYFGYYHEKYGVKNAFETIFKNEPSALVFAQNIKRNPSNYLFLANIPRYLVDLAKDEFPFLVYHESSVNNFIWILSRTDQSNRKINGNKVLLHTVIQPSNNHNKPIVVDSTQEWGPVLELGLDSILTSRHNEIHLQVDFKTNHLNNGMIVISITDKNDAVLLWRAAQLDDFKTIDTNSEWKRAYLAESLTSTFYNPNHITGSKLKVLYWNDQKQNMLLRNFHLKITEGNNFEYATIEEIN